MEDAAAFFSRRGVVEAYARTGDVHQDVARRFAAEALSPALDIGCGDGKLARLLAGSGVRWVGVNLTPAMLAGAPVPKVQGDASRLPFRSGTFGAAAALYMLYRLPEPRAAIEEASRVLRPGGLFAAAAPSRFDAPELADLLPPRGASTLFRAGAGARRPVLRGRPGRRLGRPLRAPSRRGGAAPLPRRIRRPL